jgi:ATP-dependent Clp protease ATP-binding subunit ClpA
MERMTAWLNEIGRGIYLPLDLMIVLLERGHETLGRAIASHTMGQLGLDDILERLRELGREIEDRNHIPATLERDAFSRSFARILDEAWEQAAGRASSLVTEADLLRSVMWRAEVTESASVRWAIKRLAEGGGDRLFDARGQLKRDVFDDVGWSYLNGAMQIAARSGTPFLGTPHLVAAICSVRDSVLWRAAKSRALEPTRLREELLRIIGSKPGGLPDFALGRKTLTPRMVRMLSLALRRVSDEDERAEVGERELIEAFLLDGGSSLELIQALGLEPEINKALGDARVLLDAKESEKVASTGAMWENAPPTPTLDLIGRDLTRQAREGKLPKIIGRDRELQQVINVLLRKEQRNPLLTGEAGVGKTALAVALAQRIADGDVPPPLLSQRVVEINGASLMSGTSYRGELESRIKNLLEEAGKGVILFIDEAHAVFAPRTGTQGPAEVPNHFKSALASGEIAVVGATTEAEYRRWIDQDPALKRRFERIEIREPDPSLTLKILSDLARDLEKDYQVKILLEVLHTSLDYSSRYLPEQRLPDKAKKLLMDAAIAAAHPISAEERAARRANPSEVVVTPENIAQQISLRTGIPVDRLIRNDQRWWNDLGDRLNKQHLGQKEAVAAVSRALVASRLRPSAGSRPQAVLMLFGPSGAGKGTLARALAAEVFGDPRAFMRLDMADFSESHTLSRLIGSPPGYVGYEDEDMFVTPLRQRPSRVVLLDDMDKAHPRILERLLRVFQEGEISDTRGLSADARQAIFLLSVQVDTTRAASRGIGFGGEAQGPTETDEALFKARMGELYARLKGHVDGFVALKPLNFDADVDLMRAMLERQLSALSDRLREEYGVTLSWGEDALEALRVAAQRATTDKQAPTLDALQHSIVALATDALLKGDIRVGARLMLKPTSSGFEVSPQPTTVA